jgi:drug/metabolite transporter (DMT)-like permease
MTSTTPRTPGRPAPELPPPIDLVKGALWTRRLRGAPLRVRCTAGSVWLTREGDPGDVVLRAGASYGGAGRGLLVVEALEEAQIAVSANGRLETLRGGLRALRARWQVVVALAALYVIWGSTYLAMRVGLETLPPFLMAGGRFLTAGALLYGALRLGGTPAPAARQWGAAARTGVLLLVGGNGLIAIGQQWVSSGVAAVIVSTMPLWLALFASTAAYAARRAGRAGEGAALSAPSRGEWAGLLVGFGGAALLQVGGQVHGGRAGMLLVLLAPMCWALGSLWSRSLPLPPGPMATACQMLAGGCAMLALSPLMGERLAAMPSGRSLLAVAYLIVFGSILAFSAYGFLIRNTRPAIATSYAYVNPLVAIALGIWLGGEEASATTWVAAAIVIAGVVILSRARAEGAAGRAR